MRYTLSAGSYFGIPVKIHVTFPLILIVFGLEAWINGGLMDALRTVFLILAVFVCVVLHEFGHSLQVKRYGIPVRDIILLPIGGMARAEKIPDKPMQEIIVAISGPLVNFVLAAFLFLVILLRSAPMNIQSDFLTNLFAINVVLGTFNLIPAFPMDGGRILRGILAFKLPYLKATRYAKNVGQIIALAFVVIGFVNNSFIMLPVIAVFIYFGAMNEEAMVRVNVVLAGKRVKDFLPEERVTLRVDDSIESAASAIGPSTPPVIAVTAANAAVTGVVTAADIRAAVRRGMGGAPLSGITRFEFPVLSAEMPAPQAYYLLKAEKQSFAGVIDQNDFLGLIFFKSLLG